MQQDSIRTLLFITAIMALCLTQSQQALSQSLPWQTDQQSASQQASQLQGLHSISDVPLYIDGNQSAKPPAVLPSSLISRVKNVTTLGDALQILGPAYVDPGDSMHIAHWHFQNGEMLTLWPQGNEALTDKVSVYPRPDCGVPSDQCIDLVLGRKGASGQSQHGSHGSSSGGGGMGGVSSLMKMIGR